MSPKRSKLAQRAALLVYAQELEQHVERVRAALEGRLASPEVSLANGYVRLGVKLAAYTGADRE